MFTARYVRENLEAIRESLKRRNSKYPLDRLLDIEKSWKDGRDTLEGLQAKRNKASLEISELKKGGKPIEDQVGALASIKKQIEDT